MRHMDEGRLQAWLDRDRSGLSPEEEAEIEAHLAACPECAHRLAGLRELDDTLSELLAGTAGAGEPIPEFAAVVARAREITGEEAGDDPGAGQDEAIGARRAPGAADGPRSRPAVRRPVTWAWAASVVVALGAGWLWNEMSRTGVSGVGDPTVMGAEARAEDPREPREQVAVGDTQPDEADAAASTLASAAPLREAPAGQTSEAREAETTARAPDSVPSVEPGVASPPVMALSDAASPAGAAVPDSPSDGRTAPAQAPTASPLPPAPEPTGVDPDVLARARARAAEAGLLTGRVTDTQGRPLAGTQIVLEGTNRGTLTDARGEFAVDVSGLEARPGDTVRLQALLIGYAQQSVSVRVDDASSLPSDIRLEPSAVNLEALVVSSATGREVERPAWRTVTAPEAEATAGFSPRLIPGLPLVSVQLPWDPSLDGVVRVVQALEDGGEVVLLQSSVESGFEAEGAGNAASPPAAGEPARRADVPDARVVRTLPDGLRIQASAPLSADSLSALLARIR